MLGFALAIVCLYGTIQPIDLGVESFRISCCSVLKLAKLHIGESDFHHCPLPAGPTPAFEILVHALAFGQAEAEGSHHLARPQSVQVVEARDQSIAADHRA